MDTLTTNAGSVAGLAHIVNALPHETRAVIVATHFGEPWARVQVSPMTDTKRAVFPLTPDGLTGDTNRRGQSGVFLPSNAPGGDLSPLHIVIDRARRMNRA